MPASSLGVEVHVPGLEYKVCVDVNLVVCIKK